MTMSDLLEPGTRAPDFDTVDQDGHPIRLRDFGGRPVVLYFYPADMTTGCTMEACDFRDQQGEFAALGAAVLGVSTQDAASHRQFREQNHLTFPLLLDTDKKIIRAYNALGLIGLAKRATYVIGPDGAILASWKSMNPKPHSREALRVVSEYVRSHGVPTVQAAPGATAPGGPAQV